MRHGKDIKAEIIPEVRRDRTEACWSAAKNLGFAALHTTAIVCVLNHEYTGVVIAAEAVALAPRAGAALSEARAARKATHEIAKLENLQAQLTPSGLTHVENIELPTAPAE